MLPYLLYGVEASYYAAKIRACLVYKQLPFVEHQASRRIYAEQILPRVGWPVVPVLVTPDDETVQDTSDMIDLLEARHPQRPVLPHDAAGQVLSFLLEFLGDEWLKMPAMYYRWIYNYDFALAEMGYNNDPDYPRAEQLRIGAKIAKQFQAWLAPLGVVPSSYASIEQDYLAFLHELDSHFDQHPYLLGGAPTLGDFAFYGPMYAHLLRDPASGLIMRAHAPRVVAWIDRLRAGASDASPLTDLATPPDSLLPVLRLLCRDFVPIVLAETQAVQLFLREHPLDAWLPRHCGAQQATLGRNTAQQVEVARAVFPYNQWMLQRVQDAWAATPQAERAAVRARLATCGAEDLLDIPLPLRVERRNFRLMRAA